MLEEKKRGWERREDETWRKKGGEERIQRNINFVCFSAGGYLCG